MTRTKKGAADYWHASGWQNLYHSRIGASNMNLFWKLTFRQSHTKKEQPKGRKRGIYNKEVKKQLTMSLISDELGQASTKKKEFLGIMEKLIPWSEWVGIVQPHYYKGERGNKPYDLELMLRIYVCSTSTTLRMTRRAMKSSTAVRSRSSAVWTPAVRCRMTIPSGIFGISSNGIQ